MTHKTNPVTLTSYGQAPVGLEGSSAFGAVGIGTGTWAVLSGIPEGPHALMGVRVDGAAGPLALGAKGSACDRLTPYRRVECSALGSYMYCGGPA